MTVQGKTLVEIFAEEERIRKNPLSIGGENFLEIWANYIASRKTERGKTIALRSFQAAVESHPEAQAIRARIEARVEQLKK